VDQSLIQFVKQFVNKLFE